MNYAFKRILALLLALTLCFSVLPAASAANNKTPFDDVPDGKWYTAAVNYVYANGLMSGTSSTTFGPLNQLQRGQLVTILHQLAGSPEVTGSSHFTDVPAGKYYTKAVIWAVDNGIASGKTDKLFKPKDKVTRQELAVFLFKYAELFGYDTSARANLVTFPDYKDASSWAVNSLSWAVAEGMLSGVSENGVTYLRPKKPTTRAQVASVIMAFFSTHSPKVGGEITCGISTSLNGDLGNGWWQNNSSDKLIRDLIDDYDVVTTGKGGKYEINKSVVESLSSVMNADGTKTYTVQIKEGLKYNNGDPITAADFVAYAMVGLSPLLQQVNAGMYAPWIVDASNYQNGETTTLTGLHLPDEYTYTITLSADYVPYFYELAYVSLRPLPLKQYSSAPLQVKDEGNGAYLAGGTLNLDELDAARYLYSDRISAGPYSLVSLDADAGTATLTVNPNYAGNFEGRKPLIETVHVKYVGWQSGADVVTSGEVDYISGVTDPWVISNALDLEQQGQVVTHSYERNGYGKITFHCDFSPTQFPSVRRAVAYLLDRESLSNSYAGGYGAVVNGPYGRSMWMYQQSEAELQQRLNPYKFSVDAAKAELEADGWTLNEQGKPYAGSGLRYKQVTAAEAGNYAGVVRLNDGRILMPLIIRWAASGGNYVSELLDDALIQNGIAESAGMQIELTYMSFSELMNAMYRDSGEKIYSMYNLAVNYYGGYDLSYSYCRKGTAYWDMGYNSNYIDNSLLDELSMQMVFDVEAGDNDSFLQLWVDFIDEWNDCLPDIPIYTNMYYDVMSKNVVNLKCDTLWTFQQAVLYASVK
ncbi:MAG: S-layer homology domain-containing protein [Oscillospiraceae bacterium]|nr:S-layer homology domain-containing protein [Oscillospiraceae bacterium]